MVVTQSKIAAQLLEGGRLARRTNFLPLDKMNAQSISHGVLKKAQQIVGKENVHRAIDLVRIFLFYFKRTEQ